MYNNVHTRGKKEGLGRNNTGKYKVVQGNLSEGMNMYSIFDAGDSFANIQMSKLILLNLNFQSLFKLNYTSMKLLQSVRYKNMCG